MKPDPLGNLRCSQGESTGLSQELRLRASTAPPNSS